MGISQSMCVGEPLLGSPSKLYNTSIRLSNTDFFFNTTNDKESSKAFAGDNEQKLFLKATTSIIGKRPDPNAGKKAPEGSGKKDCPEDAKQNIYDYKKYEGVVNFKIMYSFSKEKTIDGVVQRDSNGNPIMETITKALRFENNSLTFVPVSSIFDMIGSNFRVLKTQYNNQYVIKIQNTDFFIGINNNRIFVPVVYGDSYYGKVAFFSIPLPHNQNYIDYFGNATEIYNFQDPSTNTTNNQSSSTTNNQSSSTTNNQSSSTTNNQSSGTTNNQSSGTTNNQSSGTTNNEPSGITTTDQPSDRDAGPMTFPKPESQLSKEQEQKVKEREAQRDESSSDLSPGAIAGISVVSLVGFVLLFIGLYFGLKKNHEGGFGRKRKRRY